MCSQETFTHNVRVWSVANRFRVSLVTGFRPLFSLVTHHLIIPHLLRVSPLDVLTRVVVSFIIIACVQLLKELLLLLKLYLMLLDDRCLWVVFDALDESQGLLLFHIIDHLHLLLGVSAAAHLLERIGQRVEVRGAGMIGRGSPTCLDCGLGSFLIPLDRVHLVVRLTGRVVTR